MPSSSDQTTPVLNDFEALLGVAKTAFALLSERGELVWWNEALTRISEQHHQSPQAMITQLLPPYGALEPVSFGDEGLRLIEIPSQDVLMVSAASEPRLDSLTGVLTREAFSDELDQAFAVAQEKPFALLFIDLNDFKEVNDHHGHLVGDDCLKSVGERLASVVRVGDSVGRFGGDEFLILLRGVAVAPLLRPIEKRLRASVCEPIEGPEGPLAIGLSLGAAYSRDGYATPAEMVAAADRAMYRDKRADRPDVD
ncbi:putative diguanylate cyclase YcdT [Planctomycetes bacterium MalM25]|nr:putative diguanylate cyclase YcdT [Planctomycetes bacterium MalM25]